MGVDDNTKPPLTAPATAIIKKELDPPEPTGSVKVAKKDATGKLERTEKTGTTGTSKVEAKRRKASQVRTENVIAAFRFAILLGCAAIWLEHNRCPGALRMAVYDAAPLSIAF